MKIILHPHAKINIGLSIVDRRLDGFHNIETVFYPVPLYDTLSVEAAEVGGSEKLLFTCSGAETEANTDTGLLHNNLCCKAYYLLDADYDLPPTQIALQKAIPIGAGLGGGSSDAAHTLIALNNLYNLQIDNDKLTNYARSLGSDCTFFLQQQAAFGTGKGDIIKPLPLSLAGYHIIIVKPPVFVSTSEAYSRVKPQKPTHCLPQLLQAPVSEWRKTVFNDFEKTIFEKFPEIGKIKEELYDAGAVYASMSGSGASVYGIFKEKPEGVGNVHFKGDISLFYPLSLFSAA